MIEIVPAIDIIGGKCVRLSQGDYDSKKVYSENPVEIAKQFEGAGITRLHVVDLDGAKSHCIVNHKTLQSITSQTGLVVDFGGGLKTDKDLEIAFDCGASMITGGSIAVKDPQTFTGWIERFGSERIILGSDAKNKKIAISGWIESTELDLFDFLHGYMSKGICKTICTDISKDGMLQGPSFDLYVEMKKLMPDLYIIASGGISCADDIYMLNELGIDSVIIGKAFYEGHITLAQLEKFTSTNC